MSDDSTTARRARGADRRARPKQPGALARQMPWRRLANPYRPMEIVSADELEAIHLASLEILERIGVAVQSERARGLCKRAGCEIRPDGVRVRFPREIVLAAIAAAPASFEMTARDPLRNVTVGGNALVFTPVSSAPNCSDIVGGRRPGTHKDFADLIKLGQAFNVFHMLAGYPVEPIDIPVPVRHLQAVRTMIALSDKIPRIYSHSVQRVRDVLEIVRLSHDVSAEEFRTAHRCMTVINTNSPLQLDQPMVDGIIEMAEHNQPTVVTPFTLAGAMAPVTLAGALAQQNAEALSALAIAQLARPGAPVVYGAFTTAVNMRTGAPTFGTPEYAKSAIISGQLARRYRLPYRSSGIATGNAPDAQSTTESMMSTWSAIAGGVNLLHHAAGWLEGGLTASYEKLIIDVEALQMFASFLVPEVVDKETLAVDAIEAVGPGGHFFASPHTLARYETAFYQPILADWRNYETWRQDGAQDATQRAHKIAMETIAAFEPPALDPARREAIDSFIAKRTEEGGAPVN
ncbi:MAG: trimethylamine methyltransferase family protein [Alphaproteobacteria bacterium]|nr:trimethylamine methyltransferase family protein [Alphaproteobacteria bacterium]